MVVWGNYLESTKSRYVVYKQMLCRENYKKDQGGNLLLFSRRGFMIGVREASLVLFPLVFIFT